MNSAASQVCVLVKLRPSEAQVKITRALITAFGHERFIPITDVIDYDETEVFFTKIKIFSTLFKKSNLIECKRNYIYN